MSTQLRHDFKSLSVSHSIPKDREPEFGLQFENMEDHQTVYDYLAQRTDVAIISVAKPDSWFLVSLAEDTVDEQGYPTQYVRQLGLERRRRISLYPEDMSLRRFDISYKDAIKSSLRREWAAASGCLRSGEADIASKISKEIPDSHILNPDLFRVSSICITARTSYEISHALPDTGALIIYEVCNDACVFTTPHADRILGYRKEVELEATRIETASGIFLTDDEKNKLLDQSIEALENKINKLPFSGSVIPADISKVCHANKVTGDSYHITATANGMDGHQWALIQNVRAFDYLAPTRIQALARIAESLPPARLLVPGTPQGDLKGYFPKQEQFPLFPDPCLKC
jgi:hypothetical protein